MTQKKLDCFQNKIQPAKEERVARVEDEELGREDWEGGHSTDRGRFSSFPSFPLRSPVRSTVSTLGSKGLPASAPSLNSAAATVLVLTLLPPKNDLNDLKKFLMDKLSDSGASALLLA